MVEKEHRRNAIEAEAVDAETCDRKMEVGQQKLEDAPFGVIENAAGKIKESACESETSRNTNDCSRAPDWMSSIRRVAEVHPRRSVEADPVP